MRISLAIVSRRVVALAIGSYVTSVGTPATLIAQQTAPAVSQQGRSASPDSTGAPAAPLRPRAVFTSRDAVLAAAFMTVSALLIPADASIAREFQRPGPQSSGALRDAADGIQLLGASGALLFGGSLYAGGLVARKRTITDFGWHTLEALAVSGQVTSALKGLFGRTRPYAAAGDAGDFDWGGGFSTNERRSFPSGHTSTAFTLASVIAEETSHRWPRAHRFVAPIAYAAATGVGLARMYNDKHWASDVALGAAIGTLAGRIVVRYGHGRPGNLVDRFALWPVKGR